MKIWEARERLKSAGRNVASDPSVYTDEVLDIAIQDAGNDFITRTLASRASGDVQLIAGNPVLPSLSGLVGFSADRILRAYLLNPESGGGDGGYDQANSWLNVTDYYQIFAEQHRSDRIERPGQPRFIGFETATTGRVGPIPNANYMLRLIYSPPFTSWTPGSEDNITTITLNLPDDIMQMVIRWGAVSFLQVTEPENAFATVAWKNYLDLVERIRSRGPGTGGSQVSFRNSPGAPSAPINPRTVAWYR
ncbi:MAG: hypothetical protein FWD61_12500 [Phycisphaerales bacterium]|nr:hypothetical protein [Phycisphaerales bacterium]